MGEHEGPQVQALLRPARHPVPVHLHETVDAGQEIIDAEFGQRQATCRTLEPGGVDVGAESPDRTVLVGVGLQTLERLLGVVEHRRGRVEGERGVADDPVVVPAAFRVPVDQDHVVAEVRSEPGVGEDRLAFGLRPAGRGIQTEISHCCLLQGSGVAAHAAGDVDACARDVTRPVACQEGHDSRDLIRFAETGEGDLIGGQVREELLR